MAGNGKKEYVEFHLRYYPGKFKAHENLVGLLHSYQKTTGLGVRDAFAMMVLSETKNITNINFDIGEGQQKKEHEKMAKTGKEATASMTLRHSVGKQGPDEKLMEKESAKEKVEDRKEEALMENLLTDNYEDFLGEEL